METGLSTGSEEESLTDKNVSIIGAGEIGSALGRLFLTSGHSVELWDKDPARTPAGNQLSEMLPWSDVVVFCVPSWGMRAAVTKCLPHLPKRAVIVSLAKGMEKQTGKRMDEVLSELLPPRQPFALLGGPMLAEELELELPGVAVIATRRPSTFKCIEELFRASEVRCEWVSDVSAAALLGVLKNIYAIGLGIVDGLGWGFNAKGWFVVQAIHEMNEIVRQLIRKPHIAIGTAGLGDLIATGLSPDSKNHDFGYRIAKIGTPDLQSEGCISLATLIVRLGEQAKFFSLLSTIDEILNAKRDAKVAFQQLIREA